ncbi:hypothetical protein GMDG_05446 [Pseudogymnoascus destructans 20631-21]|uniref:Uncharacterized protein n=1 Tax=Pseudogymnoascus destructans (strain ATCC MYA-4855 / 20631-21) TaxID=658429 RepID=L8FN37_PSED2|nr:hypothetical protein GMDG_05446 [Pseudogymnoascus destructans 20631-21]
MKLCLSLLPEAPGFDDPGHFLVIAALQGTGLRPAFASNIPTFRHSDIPT